MARQASRVSPGWVEPAPARGSRAPHPRPPRSRRRGDPARAGLVRRPSPGEREGEPRGGFYWAGRWADADTLFAALLDTAPENVTYLRRRGVALARLGRREGALEISRRLGALDRPNLDGNHVRGQAEIAAALGERDEAVRLLQRAFAAGAIYGIDVHRNPAYDSMWGYAPWENLVRPRP